MPQTYLTFDLGASSGRAVIGRFDGRTVELEEIHRFANGPISVSGGLYWDALRLYDDMLAGLRICARISGPELAGIGIDTWGVDFALLDDTDELLGNPHCYRDPRVHGMLEKALSRVSREEIFEQTGLQFLEINTLYQLLSMAEKNPQRLRMARTFLMMPDLFNFWLTGRKACEFSNATTTQFYNPRTGGWATDLLDRLEIPVDMLPEIVPPGTPLGPLRPGIAADAGIRSGDVIAPACHDTGSAVAAVPFSDVNAAYISSGTWALLGAELPEPAVTPAALRHNFTNEGGVCGTYRFLKNITGLWIVQECRRIWENRGHAYSFAELVRLAESAPPLTSFIDPDHPDFLEPGDMPARIRTYCKRTGQTVPATEGAVIRCALESLALKCRCVLEDLESVLDRKLHTIHVVGGGIHNALLNQFTADAAGRPVVAGPAEATALGNVLMQVYARGEIDSLAGIREVVRNSTVIVPFEPAGGDAWEDAYARFRQLSVAGTGVP
ncbi:MAG: rhamnulokinase [Gemmatimonadota bacterium]|nr:rhamnulokinase [Gemmatimonadota bacterium]